MSELLPCPFCGGEAPFVINEGQTWVECGDCTARVVVGPFNTKPEAITAWNTRANQLCAVPSVEDMATAMAVKMYDEAPQHRQRWINYATAIHNLLTGGGEHGRG